MSALDGHESSATCPGRFTLATHCIGGSVGPTTGPDHVDTRKCLPPTGNATANPSVVHSAASRYTDCATLALKGHNKTYSVASVRKRTIPTERPPLVDEILMPPFVDRGVSRGQHSGSPTVVNLSFLGRSHYLSFK
jgi:hypothetical protein